MTRNQALSSCMLLALGFAAGATSAQDSGPLQLFRQQTAALSAVDAQALAATYAENAVSMGVNQPLTRGRAAIEQLYREGFMGHTMGAADGTVIDSAVSGDMGYIAYTGTHVVDGTTGRYQGVLVYRRVGGEWKTVLDASMPEGPRPQQSAPSGASAEALTADARAIRQIIAKAERGGQVPLALDYIHFSPAYLKPAVGKETPVLNPDVNRDRVPGTQRAKNAVRRLDVADGGDMAYEFADVEITTDVRRPDGTTAPEVVKNARLRVWKKVDGKWMAAASFTNRTQ